MDVTPAHLLLSASLATLTSPSAAASPQATPDAPMSDLCAPVEEDGQVYPTVKLELSGSRQSVSFGDQAKFRILFIGIGRSASILKSPAMFKDLFLNIQNENGTSVTGKPLPGRVYHGWRVPLSPNHLEFTEIGYGDVHGIEFSLPVQEIVPEPGVYSARAVYRSIVPREFSDDPDVIVREDGKCVSEPIELVVTP